MIEATQERTLAAVCRKAENAIDEIDRLEAVNLKLVEALEEIDLHAMVKTVGVTNAETIWAIRKMARVALARAKEG